MRLLSALLAALMLGFIALTPAAAGPAFPARIDLPDGFRPEGIAVGRGHTFFVGSIPTGAVYRGSLRTGDGAVLVPPQAGRAAIGIDVDRRNRVFVAGGPTGDGYVYDGDTGATLATYDFAAAGTFVNDVVVTKDAAWFTDSMQPVLYRVPIARDGMLGGQADVQMVPLTGDFSMAPGFNLNGIDASPNGKTLVVVQSNTGRLFTVDPRTGVTDEIVLAGGESVPNGDGILLDGRRLYVVQNQLNQVARIDLASRFGSGTVVSRTTDPGFAVPTTVDEFGSALYLVNARFGMPDPDTAEYWITRIPKP